MQCSRIELAPLSLPATTEERGLVALAFRSSRIIMKAGLVWTGRWSSDIIMHAYAYTRLATVSNHSHASSPVL
ncbi:hypothetical protein BS78_04G027500 [Paspalum vaginatum]|nr:hypothetical protein BS78_04G027500 [Paspalum vaginatum]